MITDLAQHARREVLKFAVQTAMFCPHCQGILDVGSTVLLEDTKRAKFAVACVGCSERAPFDGAQGCIEVYDGRVLFAKPSKSRRDGEKRAARRARK